MAHARVRLRTACLDLGPWLRRYWFDIVAACVASLTAMCGAALLG